MGQKWWHYCWSFMVVSMFHGLLSCHGCWEDERLALLHLQPFFQALGWDKYASQSDCCEWDHDRIQCDNSTGNITQLHLSYSRDVYGDQHYYLNASLFLPFQHLTTLELRSSSIAGYVENGGFEKLSSLRNLKELDLSDNYFNSSILASLANLSSLTTLYLEDIGLNGSLPIHVLNSLKNLIKLDLSHNSIENFQPSKGFELLNLPNLAYLDLSYNHLNINVVTSLRDLSSLKRLDLSGNKLEGSIHVKELHGLSNLEDLSLGDNPIKNIVASRDSKLRLEKLKKLDLSYVISFQGSNLLQSAGLFPSLKTLDVGGNIFNGSIMGKEMNALTNLEKLYLDGSSIGANFLQAISALSSLQVLSMSYCSITGRQQFNGLCRLTKLRKFAARQSEISGTIPSCFSNLSSLEILYLSSNQFSGDMAFSSLRALSSLQVLDISNNQLQIPSSLTPFLNLSNLKSLDTSGNEIYSDHMVFNHLAPSFQLKELHLSGQGLAKGFPKFLYYQHDLIDVGLSDIDFGGEHFPYWLFKNNTKLESLSLANASLFGPLTLPANSHDNLTKCFLLGYLDISDNNLFGGIPHWISNLTSLTELYMSKNILQGPLPSELSNLQLLQILDLSANFISGTIPSHFNLPQIIHLHLFKNRLKGTLPNSLCNFSHLMTMDLSNNHLTGFLPKCIGMLQQLSFLILKNNSIQDNIPLEMCQLSKLSVIDLSHNNLFGSIPHCLDITTVDDVQDHLIGELSSDELIEFQPKSMSYSYKREILFLLSGIDLSYNNFTGEIPKEIGSLYKIRVLKLSHNNLVGGIPLTISNLTQIESLDLSFNSLTGEIPAEIVSLTSLAFFNVSFNNLSGPTPKRFNQFGTFEESSYKGNPFLCGEPLSRSCMASGTRKPNPKAPMDEPENGAFMDMDFFYISFFASSVTSFSAVLVILWINPYWPNKCSYHVKVIITYCYYYVVDHFPCNCF